MVENFIRRLSNEAGEDGAGRVDRVSVMRQAAFEVGRPIVFGVAIIIAVYVPIFTLEGIEGRMFRPMAFTVCAAVIGSLILALTYIPAVASYMFAQCRRRWLLDLMTARCRWGRRNSRRRRVSAGTRRCAVVHRPSRQIRRCVDMGPCTPAPRHRFRRRVARGVPRVGAVSGNGVHAEAR